MCGEQHHPPGGGRHQDGSPPRVRGTDSFSLSSNRPFRITPACAGNSTRGSSKFDCNRDHPRVCGEQVRCLLPARPSRGSPPRVRGTAHPPARSSITHRITPACAGNRSGALETLQQAKDHPRVCGEQVYFDQESLLDMGSPPRVRGTARIK